VRARAAASVALVQMVLLITLVVASASVHIRLTRLEHALGRTYTAVERISEPVGLDPGTPAPAFLLPNTNGEHVSLDQFYGSKTLIMFAASKCMFCRSVYPHVGTFAKEHDDILVIVIVRGTAAELQGIADEFGSDAYILAWYDAVAISYKIPGTPYFFALDEQGKVIAHGCAKDSEDMERLYVN